MKTKSKAKSTASAPKARKGSKGTRESCDDPPNEPDFFFDNDLENLLSLEVVTDYCTDKDGRIIPGSIPDQTVRNLQLSDEDEFEEPPEPVKDEFQTKRKIAQKDDGIGGKKRKVSDSFEEKTDKRSTPKGKKEKLMSSVAVPKSPSTSTWTVVEIDNQEQCEQDPKLDSDDAACPKKSKKTKGVKAKKPQLGSTSPNTEDVRHASSSFNMEGWSKLGVHSAILRALSEAQFDNPTPIQNLTLGASILGKKDVVGAAETGSGKTLAFAVPILQGIMEDKERELSRQDNEDETNDLQALILTPTRELAVQIKRHIDMISTYTNIKVVVIVGGLSEQKQERLLNLKPEVVIATIGRFWEMVQNGNVHLSSLGKIRYLAIDETDRMVEKGHFQELEGILEVLNRSPEQVRLRQNFVFSATLAFTHEPPTRLTRKVKRPLEKKKMTPEIKLREIMSMLGIDEKQAKVVDITNRKGTCETLVEMVLKCQLNQKDVYLYYFLLIHPGRTIVFCNSINCVRRLVNLFYLLKMEPLALHSEMVQKQRLRSLERFAENKNGILIATDVAARGLDITNIQHVIHYQVPKTAESYIHRSGRTARAFKGGLALVFVEPSETTSFLNISRSLGREEALPTFPVDGKVLHEIKTRVDLAIKVEQFEHQVRKRSADVNWIEKAKKEMDLASSDDGNGSDSGKQITSKNLKRDKTQLAQVKAQLDSLLASNSKILRQNEHVLAAFNKIIAGSARNSEV